MMRRSFYSLCTLVVSGAFLVGCGGSSPSEPSTPPVATTPTPTPAPTPAPTPTPDPNLAPGPVNRVVLYIYQLYENGNPNSGGTPKDKTQDDQGRWLLKVGDFVVFDSTPQNASGQKCQYDDPPAYRLNDPNGAVDPRNSSNPFLYRVDAVTQGEIELVSTVDGIDSAPLRALVE